MKRKSNHAVSPTVTSGLLTAALNSNTKTSASWNLNLKIQQAMHLQLD